jgi:hypothetical protein
LTASKLAQELRALADWIEPAVGSKAVQQPVEAPTGQEVELFRYWQTAMGKPQAKLTPERRAKLRARLKEGYTPEQIRLAIDNVAGSSYHRGENTNGQEYADLTLICRNGSKLEQYAAMGAGTIQLSEPGGRESAVPQGQEALIQRLQREAAAQLAAGDVNAYNATQQQILALRGGGSSAVDRRGANGAGRSSSAGVGRGA